MGPQQVLRAAAVLLIATATSLAAPAPGAREPVAVIDLGPPDDGAARRAIGKAAYGAGLAPLDDDGVDDALAGLAGHRDDAPLAVAMADARRAFGELQCAATTTAAQRALGLLATRQAAGLPVPELARALAYVLLCADRTGDSDAAITAAARLRAVGGSPDVPDAVMAKYPDIDSVADRDLVEVDVTTDDPGATLYVDYQPAGTTPAHLTLAAGEHVIAAASGTRRGYVTGIATHAQKAIAIPLVETASRWAALAAEVAGWHGKVPSAVELAAVLDEVGARIALVRHGDTVEAWGRAGKAEPLIRLGGSDGVRPLAEAAQAAQLVADRVQRWSDRAPDPDRPLLVEARDASAKDTLNPPTKWWVYAVIGGAVLAGAGVIYAHDAANNTQHVELHYP